jgi:hypothetical protein
MKLSNKTIDIIKNFSTINQGILFKPGKVLKTVSPQKNVLAVANIEDDITKEFAIYDLNNFLTVVSLSDSNEFDFDDEHVIVSSKQGRSTIKYRFSMVSMIVTPPEKEVQFPEPEIQIKLNKEDLDWIFKTASVLATPHIGFSSDGSNVSVSAFDATGKKANVNKLNIAQGSGDVYHIHFKIESLKVIPGNYDLSISSKGVSHWKNTDVDVEYWITSETGSKYQKAQ